MHNGPRLVSRNSCKSREGEREKGRGMERASHSCRRPTETRPLDVHVHYRAAVNRKRKDFDFDRWVFSWTTLGEVQQLLTTSSQRARNTLATRGISTNTSTLKRNRSLHKFILGRYEIQAGTSCSMPFCERTVTSATSCANWRCWLPWAAFITGESETRKWHWKRLCSASPDVTRRSVRFNASKSAHLQ